MKGVVFTEFFELVEDKFGLDMIDGILEDARPDSGGAYTAVGTYDAGEMVALLGSLSRRTEVSVPALLQAFGEHLFGRFVTLYPQFFPPNHTAFDFLAGTDGYIHVEVRKLYPDAELPRLFVETRAADRMVLRYESPRSLEDLAEGLLRGCARHFADPLRIDRVLVQGADGNGSPQVVRFTLTREDPGQ